MGRSSGAVARTPTIGVSTTPLRAGDGLWYNPLRMLKKGFTLVELLIVIVVIAILTSITFRIMGVSEDQSARNTTVLRLHALESAIGGYYAAFGSYPPVRLHGSRNIYFRVNDQGVQVVDKDPVDGVLDWMRVHAACRSQPVAMNYPFDQSAWKAIVQLSQQMQKLASLNRGFSYGAAATVGFDALQTPAQLNGKSDEEEWTHLNLFRFGLMSFLLPRFLFMMQANDTTIYDKFSQWGDNNNIPCRFEDGIPDDSWEDIARQVVRPSGGEIHRETWKVALLPSQIVTARWVACLEGCCTFMSDNSGPTSVWGVELGGSGDRGPLSEPGFTAQVNFPWRYPSVFTSGELQREGNGFSQAYALDGVTVVDGWGEEFYYYSPLPHQGYRLWSAGPNNRTFPPWISETEINRFGASDAKTAREWKSDDVVHMSN